TPLSNFITADANKRVQIRIYSSAAIGTAYTHSLDRILLEVITSPVYWTKDFTRITGTGTITNTYKFTHPAATLAATTGGDDDAELSVANISGESFDYYFTFGNIQTYTGANAILIYQESRSSVATLTYRLKIYNFTTPGWEDLTTTNINATAADTVYQFAKAPVNLSDYISGNELRIGYYTSATVSGTHYVDYIYVTIGTVISDTGDVELSFGSSNGSSVLNTQDLDTTLASPNVYGINTASTATSHYANDYTPGLYNIAQAGAANITFRAAVPNGAFITGYRFAARYRSNSTFMTVRSGTFDYAGLTGTTGGWYETGTTNALTTYTYTEGWHHATDNNVEDFTANYQKKFNMRLRTTASTLGDQATIGLDFIFISARWAGSPNLLQNYYRWYVNEDNITPADPWPVGGTNLGENTAIGASDSPPGVGSVLRLRMSLVVQGQDLGASSKDFKLQYATSTNCVSVPWDQWSDVVTVASCSGPDIWCGSDNPTPNDGDTLPSTKLSVSDVAETYEESNPSALNPNSATIGQDIEYDWVIKNNNAPIETSYCFRMAKSDGDPLSAYNNYPKLGTGVTTINLTLSTPTVGLGILTPGTANTATSTATVAVSSAAVGYNLQVQRNDATSTLDLSTDGTIDFPDYTAWDPTGNGNATTMPGSTFSFRVQQTGTNSNYSTTWWGANDANGTAKYAGFPSPSSSQTIMNCDTGGTCNNGTTTSVILYRLDAPIIQQVGSYDGDITFTALVNP
ncbi:MAG: hypothetical protein Q8N90_04245, partial [bacterium]|nr:hypothetical protein [bacterium]